jgi:hypothetical protein
MIDRLFTFIGGMQGHWKVAHLDSVIGAGLEPVEHLDVQLRIKICKAI